jgi:hypothetical protein
MVYFQYISLDFFKARNTHYQLASSVMLWWLGSPLFRMSHIFLYRNIFWKKLKNRNFFGENWVKLYKWIIIRVIHVLSATGYYSITSCFLDFFNYSTLILSEMTGISKLKNFKESRKFLEKYGVARIFSP